jgi:outer membrane lipoprotein SlyB
MMTIQKTFRAGLIAMSVCGLVTLAPASYAQDAPAHTTTKSSKKSKKVCQNCGTIAEIKKLEKEGEGTGLGAIAGGVAGGLIGNQVGGGTGNTVATIAGAAGGAYVGHQVEKKARKTVQYEITVKMDNGKDFSETVDKEPAFAVGDKVKIVDGKVVAAK